MLISSEGEFKHSFKTESKWKDIDIYNDLIFVTYYMSNIVSVYKLSKYSTDKTYYLSTEFLNDFIFNIPLLEFNTKGSRTALTFSRDSTMQLFEIESAYSIVFKREIPLFKYKQNMRFLINRDTNDITYSRLEQFLYVVLYNINNDKDKKLFWFNLKDTNHDMLYSVIDLDPYYYKLDNKIFIENGKFVSTIYIYMFYGGKHYQYIKFEPDNRLQITNSDFKELWVPKNEENMHNYSPINVTMVLYPVYTDYTPTQNRSTNIVLMWMNYGLKIESKSQSNTLLYQNKEVTAKISLLDYFDGFNSNFSVTTENIDQSTYVIEEDKSYDYLLEAVNSTQKVIFIMEYSYYILVFFNQTSKLQVYKVKDGVESIEKIDKEYDYNELFKNWTIDFIDYSYLDWIDESFFILSWKIYSGKINQSFLYKVFHIDKITENSINLTMIFQTYYSYKITMASISAYVNNNTDQYSLVMLAERQTEYDTFIIFENFIWNKAFKWKVLGIYKQNGFDYMLDNFIVNSFTFLRNTSYIIASVDNYGLALIDCIPRKLVQLIPIDDKYFQVPPKKMNIYNIIPLDFYGVRVLLQDEGGFSFFWITYHTLGPVILESFTVSERFENINKELPTKLLSEFKGGYAQVIKHPNNEDNFDYFLRIYLSNNHDLSKNYKEFLIDQIDDWEAIDYITHFSDVEIGIVLVWGYQLFIYYVMIVPELTLTKQVCLNITASNKFSNQTLTIAVKSNDINSDISQGYVLLIFLLIIMTTLILFTFMFNKILNAKLKSESKSKDTDLRHSKGILFGSRRSEEVKIDRLTYEQMKKFETTLETLHENLEQEEQDDKIESNIRNSMNYKIQDNTDSYKTEMFTNRASRISNAFRNSYNRSSTKSYYESLNKKKKEGFKG